MVDSSRVLFLYLFFSLFNNHVFSIDLLLHRHVSVISLSYFNTGNSDTALCNYNYIISTWPSFSIDTEVSTNAIVIWKISSRNTFSLASEHPYLWNKDLNLVACLEINEPSSSLCSSMYARISPFGEIVCLSIPDTKNISAFLRTWNINSVLTLRRVICHYFYYTFSCPLEVSNQILAYGFCTPSSSTSTTIKEDYCITNFNLLCFSPVNTFLLLGCCDGVVKFCRVLRQSGLRIIERVPECSSSVNYIGPLAVHNDRILFSTVFVENDALRCGLSVRYILGNSIIFKKEVGSVFWIWSSNTPVSCAKFSPCGKYIALCFELADTTFVLCEQENLDYFPKYSFLRSSNLVSRSTSSIVRLNSVTTIDFFSFNSNLYILLGESVNDDVKGNIGKLSIWLVDEGELSWLIDKYVPFPIANLLVNPFKYFVVFSFNSNDPNVGKHFGIWNFLNDLNI